MILVINVQCHVQVVFSILEYNVNCDYNVTKLMVYFRRFHRGFIARHDNTHTIHDVTNRSR